MNAKKQYWVFAVLLLVIALFFLVNRSGKDQQDAINGMARDPARLVYTKHARCRMDCRHIDEEEVKQILVQGDINYSKSEPKAKPDPKYALEGITKDGQRVRIVFAADHGKVVVITAIDLEKEWPCHCD